MTPSLPRLMAQLHDDPPIELWRRSKNERELTGTAFTNLVDGMTDRKSGWRIWWERPMRDTAAFGRMITMYPDSSARNVKCRGRKPKVVDDSDLVIEQLNIPTPMPDDTAPLGTGMTFGQKKLLPVRQVAIPAAAGC